MQEQEVTGETTAEENIPAETQERKAFTQDEVDRIVQERLVRERNKLLKRYEGVDVEQYQQMLTEKQQREHDEQVKRGEFEKILQNTVNSKNTVITQLQKELHAIKVDGSLLNAASQHRAINPQQVARLLKDNIRLSESGDVEVIDDSGNIRYTDDATPMTVEQLVSGFLKENTHFVNAGPGGTGSVSKVAQANGTVNAPTIANLNMNSAADRQQFKEMMKSKGIRL